jgi:acyl-CoA reductase-like NAD-dependent aldehyde dehydrogenase
MSLLSSRQTMNGPTSGDSAGGASTYAVVHPRTGHQVLRIKAATANDIDKAIATAHAALPSWSSTPVKERRDVALKMASLLRDDSSGWKQRLREANMAETDISLQRFHPGAFVVGVSLECAQLRRRPLRRVRSNSQRRPQMVNTFH